MLIGQNNFHLSYCTNIHYSETLSQVEQLIRDIIPQIKQRVSPDDPFGLGLRISSEAANTLSDPQCLSKFKLLINHHQCYVFTINGFPYGNFGDGRIKEQVYQPNWLDPDRVSYTIKLANILSVLLPEHIEMGSISTLPGAFKTDINSDQDVAKMSNHLIEVVAHLYQLKQTSNKVIVLGLEPEPCCFLETIDEVIGFFQQSLWSEQSLCLFQELTKLSKIEAIQVLKQHLGICLDFCHTAIQFELPDMVLEKLQKAGVRIVKAQISSSLKVKPINQNEIEKLQALEEERYLHQVVAKGKNTLTRYTDISPALNNIDCHSDNELRVHFHVPVYTKFFSGLETTQQFVEQMLYQQKTSPFTEHLEVETYTWDVMPTQDKPYSVIDMICDELEWCKRYLA